MTGKLITLDHLKSASELSMQQLQELSAATVEALEELADLVASLQEENESLKNRLSNTVPVCGGLYCSNS